MAYIYDLADTWTDGATTYSAIKIDVTDTASAAASKLLDLQVGAVSQFAVDKNGNLTLLGTVDGRDVAADGAVIDSLAPVATAGTYASLTGKPSIPSSIEDLSDVNAMTPTDGQVLTWDQTNTRWDTADAVGASSLGELTDVTIGTPTSGKVLRHNGSVYTSATLDYGDLSGTPTLATVATSGSYNDLSNQPTIPANIGDLSNVTITGSTTGEVLRYNGSAWVDETLNYSDLAGAPTNISTFTNDSGYLATVTLGYSGSTTQGTVTNSGGADAVIPAASASQAGLLSAAGKSKLDGIESNAEVTSTAKVAAAGAVMESDTSTISMSFVVDEDNMASNSATKVPTQQSVKAYVDANAGSGTTVLTGLSDVYTSMAPSDGQVLTWDNANSRWDAANATGGGASTLNDLTDVTITAGATGEVLRYNGSAWVDAQLAYSDLSGTPSLATVATSGSYNDLTNQPTIPANVGDLGDVTITAAATGEVLRYNGSAWVDAQLAYSDLSGAPTNVSTFTNDSGYITATNLGYTAAATQGTVTSDQGNDATLPGATTANAGLLVAADKVKLNGIETGADVTDTANVTAAGALMDSELANEAAVKGINQALTTTSNVNFNDLTLAGNLTVNGTNNIIDTTNLAVSDSIIELSNGLTTAPINDAGIVIERGTADNAFIGWDESEDKFVLGTGSFTGSSSGNLTITKGDVALGTLTTVTDAGNTVDVRRADRIAQASSVNVDGGATLYDVTATATLTLSDLVAGDIVTIFSRSGTTTIARGTITYAYIDGDIATNKTSVTVGAGTLATVTMVSNDTAIIAGSDLT